ncbi:hypothetical protein FB639_004936 [Coemansia asiatica]|nr:hypothetical protein FB639_004936 [Coemansia asiatica]
MILGAQRSSPSTAPSLATTKVTVPKRYSVSPPFTAPQMDSSHVNGQDKPTFISKEGSGEPAAVVPAMHRSESAQSTESFELLTASMRRRRNSFDGSSSSLRRKDSSSSVENYPLSAINGASVIETSGSEHAGQQKQENQGGGRLLRRVTTTAANYRSSNRQHSDDHIGGIIGGTKDFFKNRLRSRTHSNSEAGTNGDAKGDASDRSSSKDSGPEHRMNTMSSAGSAEAQERARRRSDAEVKSRLPPLPLTLSSATGLQAQYAAKPHKQQQQQQQRRGLASEMLSPGKRPGDSEKVALHSLSPFDRRSESGRAPHLEAIRSQRKSHDDALPINQKKRADVDYGGDRRNSSRHVQTRTSSAEYARKQPSQQPSQQQQTTTRRLFAAPLESTMKLTKAQIELLRLRPASSGSGDGRKSGETAFPSLGPNDSSNDDEDGFSPPPLPKMPPLPPIPPQTAPSPLSSQRPHLGNADKKGGSGDTDSIEYHLRRLKSDKKTRRSSFMTTLSNMLGRKD